MSDLRASSGRQARRRSETRSRLVRAARTLFARQGVDNTRINEITEEADVGFGSFYNHFKSKEEIAAAVVAEMLAEEDRAITKVTAGLDDPAEILAAAHRHFVRLARTDPEWAKLLIRLDASHNLMRAGLNGFAERDLDRGIKAGRFAVPDRRVALLAAGGALLAVVRDVVDRESPADADRFHAEGVLRLMGLSREDAAEVARRRLPDGPSRE